MYSIKQIKDLQRNAVKGDREAQGLLFSYTNEIAKEVNKRLIGLEKEKYDYGQGWATAVNYTQVMYESNRFEYARNMDKDWYQMGQQSQIGIKFLGYESSSVEGQRAIEERRFRKFKEKGIFDETVTRRKARNFLRFLGNEESEQVIESYGNSSTVIEMLWDAYQKKDNSRAKMVKAFDEFNAGLYDFDETMRRLKIDITQYPRKKRD